MFLKRISIRKNGKRHTYWALVKSIRTPPDPVPEKVEVLVRSARVERTRDFGDIYLGLLLWQTLELDKLLDRKMDRGRSRISWSMMTALLTLARLAARLHRRKKKTDCSQVERQIGRILGRNSRAASLFEITVREIERDSVKGHLEVAWKKKNAWREWARLSEGCYVLRTNLRDWKAEDLWKSYIQLTQAESAFRTQKSELHPFRTQKFELHLRPIWHHREDRVQAHILFSFLAYALWKTLEQWMERSGLGNGPRTVIEEFQRIKSTDVVLATSTGRDVWIRCITTPDEAQRILFDRLGVTLPMRLGEPKWHDENT